jgi:HAD superfamily 5'-nucleotidase-like hydrolase
MTPPLPVFKQLELDAIDCVGFDLDGTLAVYRDTFIAAVATEAVALLASGGYPADIRALRYDTGFGVRGLWIDKRHGNMLRVSATGSASHAIHGTSVLSEKTLLELYAPATVLGGAMFFEVENVFALPVAVIFGPLVEFMERQPTARRPHQVFADVLRAVGATLESASFSATVAADLGAYLHRDERLEATLDGLHRMGKRLFLLTNAKWPHLDAVMRHLLTRGPDGRPWHDRFDAVVFEAAKPSFFSASAPGDVVAALPSKVLKGGSAQHLEARLNAQASRILYVGDSVREDLAVTPVRGWHSALVAPELGDRPSETGVAPAAWAVSGGEPVAAHLHRRAAQHATLLLGRVSDLLEPAAVSD